MTDTATPETGPVDAPASVESIVAELEAGGDTPGDAFADVTQELVNEAEGHTGDSPAEPGTEDDATDPAEQAGDPEEGNPAEDKQLVTVKVNGEERQIPLSEALAGYSRLEDYKAKTAEVANERRQLEQQRSTLEADVKAQYASQLEEATNLFAQFDPVLAEAQTLDWAALKAADPAAYVAAQDAVNQRLTAIQRMNQQVQAERAEAQQRQQEQADHERAERFDQAANKIVEAMPELADEAKFKAFANDAVTHLRNEGFSAAEIADSLDDRVLKLADKARRWDAHVAAQKSLPDKRVVTKSAVKPLKTDGAGSRSNAPRFPSNASRDSKADWIANQILSE